MPTPTGTWAFSDRPIHAEVGDTVVVVFKNNSHLPLSFHAHGLRYLKAFEGAPYRDGGKLAEKPGDAVAPGATYTYKFDVPERSGPGPMDPSSILWMYHSHTDELHDVNTGLMGPIVVTRRGAAKPDGSPAMSTVKHLRSSARSMKRRAGFLRKISRTAASIRGM